MVRRKSRWERRQLNGRDRVTGDEPADKRPWDVKIFLYLQRRLDKYIWWRLEDPKRQIHADRESGRGPMQERRLPGWRHYRHLWYGGPIDWHQTNKVARRENYDIIKVVKQW